MSYRSADLAIDPGIIRRLRMAITLYPRKTIVTVKHDFGGPTTLRPMSVEELAAEILNNHIAREFPAVLELEKQVAQLEKKMVEP